VLKLSDKDFPAFDDHQELMMKPDDAFVTVQYQDMWFWDENTDHESKRSLV
jgi:hypothetical protein